MKHILQLTPLSFCIVMLLFTSAATAQDFPIAHNDTIEFSFPVEEDTINITEQLLANDLWPDSIEVNFFVPSMPGNNTTQEADSILISTHTVENHLFYKSGLIEVGRYILKNKPEFYPNMEHLDTATAVVYYKINNHNHDTLDINNISALINNYNNQFWNKDNRHFEVPKGEGTHSMFSSALWVGGLDENDSLHFAGELYRYGPNINDNTADFWAGPVASDYDENYDKNYTYSIWKLTKEEILYHKNNWDESGYVVNETISSWPGNGNPENGEAEQLAPYFDYNSNGIYEPMNGDYPIIRGDQAIFFIFNDTRYIHTETTGTPLGVEIHGMAYAYNDAQDPVLNNTLFFHYDIHNRSDTTYYDTYLGLFADIDLGYFGDDYVKSDVTNGIFYGYNGDDIDGTGEPFAYGENPPAQAVQIIAGPKLDGDNTDNPAYEGDCSIFDFSLPDGDPDKGYAINGLNFGDDVADNERFGLSRFVYFSSPAGSFAGEYQLDPRVADEYYNYLNGLWMDSTEMIYGGNGHETSGGYGPVANFMFPAESDTCLWGTNGQEPDGPVNWTEETAGNEPGDRRGLGVVGPFTFEAGTSEQLDIAYVFARSEDPEMSSEDLLLSHVRTLSNMAENHQLELEQPGEVIGVEENKSDKKSFKIYPNPAKNVVYIEGLKDAGTRITYRITELTGRIAQSGNLKNNSININALNSGMYILSLNVNGYRVSKKIFITH